MVSFDPFTAVTAPGDWEDRPEWEAVPAFDPDGLPPRLIMFSAHPDDETLGAGGLLAIAADRGVEVTVVAATSDDPARLDELAEALAVLGLPDARVVPLHLPDGALKHHADTLHAAIARVLDAAPGPRLLLAPWPGDRHGDHRTLGREVARAAEERGETVLSYPVWLWQWGRPDDVPWQRLRAVELTPAQRRRKREALRSFTSQLRSPANPAGVLAEGFVQRAAEGREALILAERAALDEHFERLHREREDPWSVRSRWYERRKRALIAAVLPRERYGRAFEVGCSVGELTAVLAERCDALLAVDASAAAVETAARRVASFPQAVVERARVPRDWPEGPFDLVLVSEVAYYLAADEWRDAVDRCVASLAPGGEVVLCHWTGHADDFAQSGVEAHRVFRERSGLEVVVEHRDEGFLLEVLRRPEMLRRPEGPRRPEDSRPEATA
ncbi:bifunctional PIG-L family deacetylase/class I SAM-dependent methyltransferase [Leifsonia sp. F6_8S_P_1B]|uniref:Bifunctional PIG-L family deacetylase/class I SAM-dependent methyltransferase n=1 Tax=Leifsonia williamsii TaxID=3035919 RepID=A0ABT8KAY4_9MICO|nr:bifunctional PIG-L family deacetylase/class I SAM-dependent methyltransferase [Leifsonia williamsii]MDN4614616.1 bifunctional PIG-L family deacetylase/class I SAM-dependent methyltransferase [Leifsonia williamsii]